MTETDPEKRKRLYHRLQAIAYEDVPTLFIVNSVRYRTQRSWVRGFSYNPVFANSPYMCPLFYVSKM